MKNPRFPGKTRGFQKVGVLHCFAKVFYHLPIPCWRIGFFVSTPFLMIQTSEPE